MSHDETNSVDLSDSRLIKLAKLKKDELKALIVKVRRKTIRAALNERSKFVEYRNEYGERRIASKIVLTGYYMIKDPEDNNSDLFHVSRGQLVEEVAKGTGDFFSL